MNSEKKAKPNMKYHISTSNKIEITNYGKNIMVTDRSVSKDSTSTENSLDNLKTNQKNDDSNKKKASFWAKYKKFFLIISIAAIPTIILAATLIVQSLTPKTGT